MSIIIFLFLLLFLLFYLTAITYSLKGLSFEAQQPTQINEECSRNFIRDNWIFGSDVTPPCPSLQNDFYVVDNLLFQRDIVSMQNCCSFSSLGINVPYPSVLVGNTLRSFTNGELNTKPYISDLYRRYYTPACIFCNPATTVIMSHLEGDIYQVQSNRGLEVYVRGNLYFPYLVVDNSGSRPIIEAEVRNGVLTLVIPESDASPVTLQIIQIANGPIGGTGRTAYFQPLPLP